MTTSYKIQCNGAVHTVEYSEATGVVFRDHEAGFGEYWQEQTVLALLASDRSILDLITAINGCQRVACRLAGGPGNYCNRDADERRLYAELRGVRLGSGLKARRSA